MLTSYSPYICCWQTGQIMSRLAALELGSCRPTVQECRSVACAKDLSRLGIDIPTKYQVAAEERAS